MVDKLNTNQQMTFFLCKGKTYSIYEFYIHRDILKLVLITIFPIILSITTYCFIRCLFGKATGPNVGGARFWRVQNVR